MECKRKLCHLRFVVQDLLELIPAHVYTFSILANTQFNFERIKMKDLDSFAKFYRNRYGIKGRPSTRLQEKIEEAWNEYRNDPMAYMKSMSPIPQQPQPQSQEQSLIVPLQPHKQLKAPSTAPSVVPKSIQRLPVLMSSQVREFGFVKCQATLHRTNLNEWICYYRYQSWIWTMRDLASTWSAARRCSELLSVAWRLLRQVVVVS